MICWFGVRQIQVTWVSISVLKLKPPTRGATLLFNLLIVIERIRHRTTICHY